MKLGFIYNYLSLNFLKVSALLSYSYSLITYLSTFDTSSNSLMNWLVAGFVSIQWMTYPLFTPYCSNVLESLSNLQTIVPDYSYNSRLWSSTFDPKRFSNWILHIKILQFLSNFNSARRNFIHEWVASRIRLEEL